MTNLHLLRVELRCKLQEKLHSVTGLLMSSVTPHEILKQSKQTHRFGKSFEEHSVQVCRFDVTSNTNLTLLYDSEPRVAVDTDLQRERKSTNVSKNRYTQAV